MCIRLPASDIMKDLKLHWPPNRYGVLEGQFSNFGPEENVNGGAKSGARAAVRSSALANQPEAERLLHSYKSAPETV